jgi:FkbM family methyltransferase
MFERLRYHARYLSYAMGAGRTLCGRRYDMQGYFPDKFCLNAAHEPHVVNLIGELLHARRGTFIDVGVNLGQTLSKVLGADPERDYVGFEPQISCCFYVDQFIRRNAIAHARVIPVALGEADAFLQLHASNDLDEFASLDATGLRATADGSWHAVLVPVVHGDRAIERLQLEAVSVIKIDVEGAELKVLRGLEATLRRYRPAVMFEVIPNFVRIDGTAIDPALADAHSRRAQEIMDFFGRLHYGVQRIDKAGATVAIDRFALDDRQACPSMEYLALPNSIPLDQGRTEWHRSRSDK